VSRPPYGSSLSIQSYLSTPLVTTQTRMVPFILPLFLFVFYTSSIFRVYCPDCDNGTATPTLTIPNQYAAYPLHKAGVWLARSSAPLSFACLCPASTCWRTTRNLVYSLSLHGYDWTEEGADTPGVGQGMLQKQGSTSASSLCVLPALSHPAGSALC
jgi:hypothetical protein